VAEKAWFYALLGLLKVANCPHEIGDSIVNQFVLDNLIRAGADIVGLSDPCQLVIGFKLFGHTLRFHHLLDYPFPPLAGGNVNFMQMSPQFTGHKQFQVQIPFVIFQIVEPPLSPNADVDFFSKPVVRQSERSGIR